MFQLFIALTGIVIGTITDLKKREVPDWVNYSMMGAGLGIAAMYSLYLLTPWIFLFSLAGLAAGYLVGAAMYYTGQWGGGDAKMMMGIGALATLPFLQSWLGLPTPFKPLNPEWWTLVLTQTTLPFFPIFLIASVFAGAGYGMVWMAYLSIKHRKRVYARLKERLYTKNMVRTRLAVIIVAVLIALIGLLFPGSVTFMFVLLAALLYITFYLFIAVKAVEETCFVQQRAVKDLVEGDWMVEDVKRKGFELAAPAAGLTKEDIQALKKHKVKEVTIKEGIPFVPSFLIAFLAAWYIFHNELPVFFWW